jgi:hypothetical protein
VTREIYYLKKYIPILNSVISSSITERKIRQTLLLKLKALRAANKKDSTVTLVYAYDITENGINKKATLYNSSNEVSRSLVLPISGILIYKNTSIPYRGKLFCNYPIIDFNKVLEESKNLHPKGY